MRQIDVTRFYLMLFREYAFNRLIVRPHFPRYARRFQAFCPGLLRAGTRSLTHMLATYYHVHHEPDITKYITYVNARDAVPLASRYRWLRLSDARKNFAFEAGVVLALIIPDLLSCFPDAKWIVLDRDKEEWVQSMIAMNQTGERFQHRTTRQAAHEHTFWKEQDRQYGITCHADAYDVLHGLYRALPHAQKLIVHVNRLALPQTARMIAGFLTIPGDTIGTPTYGPARAAF